MSPKGTPGGFLKRSPTRATSSGQPERRPRLLRSARQRCRLRSPVEVNIPRDSFRATPLALPSCLQSPVATAPADIATVLNVQGKVSSSDQTFTVTLAKFPGERSQKIYYKCKKAEDDVCLVALLLPPATGSSKYSTVELIVCVPRSRSLGHLPAVDQTYQYIK